MDVGSGDAAAGVRTQRVRGRGGELAGDGDEAGIQRRGSGEQAHRGRWFGSEIYRQLGGGARELLRRVDPAFNSGGESGAVRVYGGIGPLVVSGDAVHE